MNYTSTAYDLPHNIKLVVRQVVDRKGEIHGPDAAMIINVIGNFRTVQKNLLNDIDGVEDGEQFPTAEPIDSDDYRVQVFGPVRVKLATGVYTANISMFNEYTDAIDTIELMREMMRGLWASGNLPEGGTQNGNGNGAPPPPPRQDNGAEDLDEWFPRDDEQTDSAPAGANSTDNTNHIALFDNKSSEHYERKFTGQVVTVDICKIANMYRTKKDGTSAYQIFEFYPFYTGNGGDVIPSAYPAYTLNTFPPRNNDQWSWAGYRELRELVPSAGDSADGHFVCKFKVNQSKGKTYWNICGIETVEVETHYTPDGEPALDMEAADEIPF